MRAPGNDVDGPPERPAAIAYVHPIASATGLAQRQVLRAWSVGARRPIVGWFVEKAGPRSLDDRPELLRALSRLGPDAGVLCVTRPAVLHDTVWGSAVVEHVAARAGGQIAYAAADSEREGSDLDQALDAHDRLLARLQVARAEELGRSRDAVWGRCPWGYRLSADGLNLEPNPAEQAVTTVIRHMRLRGLKLRQIRDELVLLGVLGRTGKPLSISRIHVLLGEAEQHPLGALDVSRVPDPDTPPESIVRPSPPPRQFSAGRRRRRDAVGGA